MACEDLSLTFVRVLGAICWTSGLLAIAENLTVILAVRYIRSLRPTARFFYGISRCGRTSLRDHS